MKRLSGFGKRAKNGLYTHSPFWGDTGRFAPAVERYRWVCVDFGAWFEGEIARLAAHTVIFGLKVVRFPSIYEKPIKKARAT